ncbi:MAG: hypothetical protein WB392_08940 [Methanotrichaceae archaeon]
MTASKPYRLGNFEEAFGIVNEVHKEERFLIIQLGKLSFILPPEMEKELHGYIGKRIGILHTDIPQKQYLVHLIQ